jgi:predicted ATPase/class 3 adenylate cyclase
MVQPSGRVGLFFTDVEGSTRLLQQLGAERYSELLDRHRTLIRSAAAAHGGYEVDSEGDAFFVAFASADSAVAAALAAQQALIAEPWPAGAELRVRMGVHVGEPLLRPPKYVGLDVHRAARIMAAAHGGQVLVSNETAEAVFGRFDVRDLGEHRLKDLLEPVRLFQLVGAGILDEFPPPRGVRPRGADLPVAAHRLLGREVELRELGTLLRRTDHRVLTLTGTGGVGKSRLALEAATQSAAAFADGAVFVGLGTVGDAADVLAAVAHALGVREQPPAPLRETIVASVADRELLLVLDNFEHVVAAAPDVSAVLAASPRLKIIATSRGRLNIAGEHVFRVSPLPAADGVQLFAERATAVSSSFRIDETNAAVVGRLCARLDGLPLAIELAAARVAVLSEHEILARLRDRFALLRGNRSDADPRQRTLRATLDWSHALLGAEEQTLLATLSIFVGGCVLDGVEAVAGGEVVDNLGALVDANLLNRVVDDEGESRYSMFETIHEYARERLTETGTEDELRRRHASYVADLVEAAEAGEARSRRMWLARLDREEGNVRAAIEWAMAPDPEIAGRIVSALWFPWTSLGHVGEGRRWTSELLERSPREDSLARARLLQAAAHFAEGVDVDEFRSLAEECLDVSRRVGYAHGVAMSLGHLASEAASSSDAERARALGDDAARMVDGVDDPSVLEHLLNALCVSALARGDYREAIRIGERILASMESTDDPVAVARALGNLAYCHICVGNYAVAEPLAEESLSLERELQNRSGVAWAAANAGLASVFLEKPAQAERHFREALALTREFGHTRRAAESLLGLAAVAAQGGQTERAAELSGSARALVRQVGSELTALERQLCDLYLGESGSSEAGEPRRRSLEEIIDAALTTPLTQVLRAD